MKWLKIKPNYQKMLEAVDKEEDTLDALAEEEAEKRAVVVSSGKSLKDSMTELIAIQYLRGKNEVLESDFDSINDKYKKDRYMSFIYVTYIERNILPEIYKKLQFYCKKYANVLIKIKKLNMATSETAIADIIYHIANQINDENDKMKVSECGDIVMSMHKYTENNEEKYVPIDQIQITEAMIFNHTNGLLYVANGKHSIHDLIEIIRRYSFCIVKDKSKEQNEFEIQDTMYYGLKTVLKKEITDSMKKDKMLMQTLLPALTLIKSPSKEKVVSKIMKEGN